MLVDLGVLSIKQFSIPASFYRNEDSTIPKLPPSHPAIVEWRAMTVIELYVLISFCLLLSIPVCFLSLGCQLTSGARVHTSFDECTRDLLAPSGRQAEFSRF